MAVLSDDIFAQLEQWNRHTDQAAATVDPGTAAHLDQYAQRYWWMAPDAMFSLAKAGIPVTDPAAQAAAASAAHLQAGGLGFARIGSPVTAPAAPVDTSNVFAALDQLGQKNAGPGPSSSMQAAGPNDPQAGVRRLLGIEGPISPTSPVQQIMGDDWSKLSGDEKQQFAQLSFTPADNPGYTTYVNNQPVFRPSATPEYTVGGLDNLSPAARSRFDELLNKGGKDWYLFRNTDESVDPAAVQVSLRSRAAGGDGAAEQLLGIAGGTPVLGPALRTATVALSAPLQEVQGAIRDVHQIAYEHELPNFESQSDLGVVAGDLLHGRDVDLGAGPFAGGQVHQELERRQLLRGTINGEGITAGRWLADALPDSVLGQHVMEPGSNEYRILSGTVDAAAAIYLDPVAWGLKGASIAREQANLIHGPGSVTQAVQTFRQTGEVLPALRTFQEAGGISGLRGVTSPDAVNKWIDAPEQMPFHQAVAANPDPYSIWTGFNRQLPLDAAAQLADAQTPAEVAEILRGRMGGYVTQKPTLNDMVAGPGIGRLGVSPPGNEVGVLHSSVPSRWVSMMPNDTVAADSLGANAVQMERWATLAKIPDDDFRRLFDQMARATDPIERRNVWEELFQIPEDQLVAKGVPVEKARLLTRMNQADETAMRVYATREVALGRGSLDNQLVLDGSPVFVADNQPTFLAQTLHRDIHLPDPRALRRALSVAAPILERPGVQGAEHLLTSAQGVWKQFQIATVKTMIKVLGDEALSMSARGYDSLLSAHPISALSVILGTPLAELPEDAAFLARLRNATARGMRWGAGQLPGVEAQGTLRAGVSSEGAIPFDSMPEIQTVLGKGLDTVVGDRLGVLHAPDWRILARQDGVNDTEFLRAFGRHFAQYAASPDTRGLARAASLTDAQDLYWDGTLSPFRKGLMESRPDLALDTRAGSDAQVVKLLDQMQTVTNGNPELMDAIRTGRLGDTTIWEATHDGSPQISENYYRKLAAYRDDFPTSTPQQKAIFSRDVARRQVADNMFGRAVHLLLSVPSATLSKSPLFRQAYWERIIDNAPFMTADAQAAVLRIAHGEANIGADLTAELEHVITQSGRAGGPEGILKIDQADQIAKGHALDMVRRTTHEFSERNQGMDMLRLLTPFGEVWRKTIKRWANIINQNPAAIRRAMQGYQALQSPQLGQVMGAPTVPGPDGIPVQQGFFHVDANGSEVFTIPGSEWATQALTGVPVPLVGQVKGLSLGTEFFPALGPVASIPVAWSLQQVHAAPSVTETLFPYGAPTDVSDLWNYAPTWMRRAFGADRATSPDSVRSFNYSVIDVIRYGITNGDYDTSTPAGIQHAVEDATGKAHTLALVRGAANYFVPGAPSPQFVVKDKAGQLIDASILVDEYRKLADADPNTAGQKFLDMYGTDVFKAITAKSYAYVFGIPTSADSVKWVDDHASVKTDFPHIYGYFAPPSDPSKFDYQTYIDQLQPEGGRQALTPDQWAKVANARAAALQYGHYRDMVDQANGGQPTSDNQRAWLANVKANLMKQYPGYEESLYGGNALPQRPSSKVLTDEAQAALKDPTVKGTEAGQGMVSYLSVQAKVDDAWTAAGYSAGTWQTSAGDWAIQLRAYMRQIGANVEKTHPQFGPLFEDVFGRAMRVDTDPRALTPGG